MEPPSLLSGQSRTVSWFEVQTLEKFLALRRRQIERMADTGKLLRDRFTKPSDTHFSTEDNRSESSLPTTSTQRVELEPRFGSHTGSELEFLVELQRHSDRERHLLLQQAAVFECLVARLQNTIQHERGDAKSAAILAAEQKAVLAQENKKLAESVASYKGELRASDAVTKKTSIESEAVIEWLQFCETKVGKSKAIQDNTKDCVDVTQQMSLLKWENEKYKIDITELETSLRKYMSKSKGLKHENNDLMFLRDDLTVNRYELRNRCMRMAEILRHGSSEAPIHLGESELDLLDDLPGQWNEEDELATYQRSQRAIRKRLRMAKGGVGSNCAASDAPQRLVADNRNTHRADGDLARTRFVVRPKRSNDRMNVFASR